MQRGGRAMICGTQPAVPDVLETTGIAALIPLCDSRAAVVEALRALPPPLLFRIDPCLAEAARWLPARR
jgi:hypothetical protein